MSTHYLYTKNGRPLTQEGTDIFAGSGTHVARLKGHLAYDPNGKYVGTLVGDRLIYRSPDSSTIGVPFSRAYRTPSGRANQGPTTQWGDEPPIPN